MRLRKQRKPVQDQLRADLLRDTDDDVRNDDAKKEHIAIIAGHEDQRGQNDIDEIEQRHQIVPKDHLKALRRLFELLVIFSLCSARRGLSAGEPGSQIGL